MWKGIGTHLDSYIIYLLSLSYFDEQCFYLGWAF